MADLKNIVVLYGGSSSEREVSLQSGNRVYDALIDLGHEVFLIDLNELRDLEHLKQHDLVFIALHGHEGESGQLQKKLDELNILYTGSGYLACSNTWNKSSFKDILEKESLPTPRGFSVNKLHDDIQSPFEIFHEKYNIEIKDLFLKPEEDGSSIDIFEISSKNDLINAIQLASNPDRAFIFEEAIKYKEYTVSIINNKCLPILEIKTNNSFYDYDAKYLSNDTQSVDDLEDKNKIDFDPFSDTMTYNPWQVESLEAFSYLKCPECPFDCKEDVIFQDHALENHPLSIVLFGER